MPLRLVVEGPEVALTYAAPCLAASVVKAVVLPAPGSAISTNAGASAKLVSGADFPSVRSRSRSSTTVQVLGAT